MGGGLFPNRTVNKTKDERGRGLGPNFFCKRKTSRIQKDRGEKGWKRGRAEYGGEGDRRHLFGFLRMGGGGKFGRGPGGLASSFWEIKS